jgi:hypothetical protein
MALNFLGMLFDVLIFAIGSLPLYFAVRFLGGKTSFLKAILVNLVVGIIFTAVKAQFRLFGGIIAFFLMVWIYHEVFRLRWLKSFIVWFVQLIFIALIYLILFLAALLLGLPLLLAMIPKAF